MSETKFKERLLVFEKQFGQAVADKNISTFGDAAKYGLDWMYNAMQAENAQLRAALQNLIDEQNGPPLETRRAQWEVAVADARAILSK